MTPRKRNRDTTRCRYCGEPVKYDPGTFTWTHVSPGADHAPIPEGKR
jgi:hypothetical protein